MYNLNKFKYKEYVIVLTLIFSIELIFFNFNNLANLSNSSINKNVVYNSESIEFLNWNKENKFYVSNNDPIMVINNINMEVTDIIVSIKGEGIVPYVDIFSIKASNINLSEDDLIRIPILIEGRFSRNIRVNVDEYIGDLRIDLAEESGVELEDISVIINPSIIFISYARIIAMILIYITSKFLFSLQKNPKYY